MKSIEQDLHVHTILSKCANAELATVENYLIAAEKSGLKTIGFADHCWAAQLPGENNWYRGQNIEHVMMIKEQIANISDRQGIRILV